MYSLVWGRSQAWDVRASAENLEACVRVPWQHLELAELISQICSAEAFASTQKVIRPSGVFRSPSNSEPSLILKGNTVTYSCPESIIYAN